MLVSAQNPSLYGSNVTLTAAVTPVWPATTIPTGGVQFYTNGIACDGLKLLGGGVASITLPVLPLGSNTVKVAYMGDSRFLGSIDSVVQVVRVITQPPSTLGIHRNSDGTVTVTFSGTSSAEYVVQASDNLGSPTAWLSVSTNTATTNGQWTLTDAMTNHSIRFYRAMVP